MVARTDTKSILAKSLMELTRKKSLQKITINEITGNCSMRRETFYYHFGDKNELIKWIYIEKLTDIIDAYMGQESFCVTIARLLRFVKNNSKFYIDALQNTEYNNFHNALVFEIINSLSKFIMEQQGMDSLSREISFAINFHTFAHVGVMEDWLKKNKPETTAELAELMTRSMPECLKVCIGDVTLPANEIELILRTE